MTYTLRMGSANGVGIPRAAESAAYSGSIDPLMLFISCLPSCLPKPLPATRAVTTLSRRMHWCWRTAPAGCRLLSTLQMRVLLGCSRSWRRCVGFLYNLRVEKQGNTWPEQMRKRRLSVDQRGWPTSRARCTSSLSSSDAKPPHLSALQLGTSAPCTSRALILSPPT